VVAASLQASEKPIHVYERVELTFHAVNPYDNAYTDVELWVDLRGPGFSRRCYGFWDGGQVFKVRITSTRPGKWTWVSGSNQNDSGLNGQSGEFSSVPWTESEMLENPNRRGIITATPNGHALQYADGTPFFAIGDFFYGACSARYRWRDEEDDYPVNTEQGGFKDMVKFREKQGFNMLFVFSAFPSWLSDGNPAAFKDQAGVPIRDAWVNGNEQTAQDMRNEDGETPFLYPGKAVGYPDAAPDFTRINPGFFRRLDQKMDYAFAHGFSVFIETLRRDILPHLKAYYGHCDPDMKRNATYHYIRYIFARYQADPVIFGIIHWDHYNEYSLYPDELRVPIDGFFKRYGDPAFGQLVTTNVSGSTYRAWGHVGESPWLSMHQTGNTPRSHIISDYILEMFRLPRPLPVYSQEPWYIKNDSPDERRKFRSTLYASLLSGAFVGVSYQAQGMTRGVREPSNQFPMMWEAMEWKSAREAVYARDFLLADCPDYPELIPSPESLVPQRSSAIEPDAYWQNGANLPQEGWSFCCYHADKRLFKLYLERAAVPPVLSGLEPDAPYEARWFDPRSGQWSPVGSGTLLSDAQGKMQIPPCPTKDDDWGLTLLRQ
jgi:hypothetical protein